RRFEDPEQELRRRREDMVRRQEVFTFMEDNSPRRWRMFQDIPEGPRKQRIRELFTSRYQTMERVREQGDQELYDVLIARLKAEDEAWGKAVDLRNAPEDEKSERRK